MYTVENTGDICFFPTRLCKGYLSAAQSAPACVRRQMLPASAAETTPAHWPTADGAYPEAVRPSNRLHTQLSSAVLLGE